MPWKVSGVMEERIEFVVRGVFREKPIRQLCREYGVSPPTGYKWLKRFKEEGFSGLVDQSRRPHKVANRTVEWKERRVGELRQQYGWGARKIEVLLAAEGTRIPERTINRILKRNGWVRRQEVSRPATKRFERARPNELWQMDFKGEYRLQEGGYCYPLSIIDDHSRFCVGLYGLARQKGEAVWDRVCQAFDCFGVPDSMLLDHGSPWWGSANKLGLSRLRVRLMEQGIDLLWSGISHPQTQGKVERLHSTLAQAVKHRGGPPQQFHQWQPLLSQIRSEYNQVRPHESLQMATPATRYHASEKAFEKTPTPWQYPQWYQAIDIDGSGSLRWRKRRHFISMALVGRQVGVLPLQDRLLVRFRQSYLCEVDLKRGEVRSLEFQKGED